MNLVVAVAVVVAAVLHVGAVDGVGGGGGAGEPVVVVGSHVVHAVDVADGLLQLHGRTPLVHRSKRIKLISIKLNNI